MRLIILVLLLYSFDSYSEDDYETISRKVWAAYIECDDQRGKSSMAYFQKKSDECLAANPKYTLDECDDLAEQQMFEWEEREEYKTRCDHLYPTTFRPTQNNDFGLEWVGAFAGLMAANADQHETAVKILQECSAVGSSECTYRLGQIKYYRDSVKDIEGGLKLLEIAAEQGHEGAIKELELIALEKNLNNKKGQQGSSIKGVGKTTGKQPR